MKMGICIIGDNIMVQSKKSIILTLSFSTALSSFFNPLHAYSQTVPNIEAAELLSGFSQLNNTEQGRQVLRENLEFSIATNNNATAEQRQQAIYDNTIAYLLGSFTNGMLGADALGPQLSQAYLAQNTISRDYKITTFSETFGNLMNQAATLTGSDSAFAKNFYANGSINGDPNDTAEGITLPADGAYNIYDIAYNPNPENANTVGNSRPVQVAPDRIQSFSGTDYFGQNITTGKDILPGVTSNASFPSGHSSGGFTTTMLMAMMVPERYQEFLTRGGEYGNSRIVLGVHYALDVIGARIHTTYALAQMLNNNPDYLNQPISSFTGQSSTTTSDFQALFLAAQSDLRNMLNASCYGDLTICTSAKSPDDRFNDHRENKKNYNYWLTYGMSAVGATNLDPVVPEGAEILIATRFPYLNKEQLREVLATTEQQSGLPLDDGSGWARLNLFNAADGYGAFKGHVILTMDADKGGFNAYDTWYNDIGDYKSPQTGIVSQGFLTKQGTGTLELAGFSHWTGDTTIDNGSLIFTGGGDLKSSLNNHATLALTSPLNPYPGHQLSVGSYRGSIGSTIILATELHDDHSKSDLLHIKGGAYGQSAIQIVSAGGYGAPTKEGIKLIEIDGPSDAEFILANSNYVTKSGHKSLIQGLYGYSLYQNGVSTPHDGNWYLRSHYQPAVPIYEAYGQTLLELNQTGTMRERVGARYWDNAVLMTEDSQQNSETNAFWSKITGGYGEYKADISTSDANFRTTLYKMEAGLDGRFIENDHGQLVGGIIVSYINGASRIRSQAGDGKIDTDGYSIGASLTWYGDNGFYSDNLIRGTWYNSDLNSSQLGGLITSNDGTGLALSSELGRRMSLSNGWIMTPQAQLSWSSIDFDDFHDHYNIDVVLDRAESLRGRVGLSFEKETIKKAENGTSNTTGIYAIANLFHEFQDGVRVHLNEKSFKNQQDRLWGGIGSGISHKWHDGKYTLYGEGSIKSSLENIGDSYALKASAGFKMHW
ncbi:autotransporter outer membrane beta-barrel domain-containing protein [Bartonella tamiae]|uniref:Outer membrane autotransporter barrel domain-containing protein n=1 Tax=Bartonella tamiae Th239 TaxID=1094558 RepID=J1K1Q4_9HYPH|nr:autotransporter outer membrane beta-barrel domain-containing protein [Bartonella tamiae]EJF90985.1 outer membrane autotransporter barrel domain-containing protein [Bartonella tamiae Th239]EJF93350.1 outer membrane autotransporter barrel domain-containing protein [Bartonella tamiae Th307]